MQALIVDDSSTMRKVLKSILIGAGFKCSRRNVGLKRSTCLKQNPADVGSVRLEHAGDDRD